MVSDRAALERARLIRQGMLRAARLCERRGQLAHKILMEKATPGSRQAIALCHEAEASDECARQIRRDAKRVK